MAQNSSLQPIMLDMAICMQISVMPNVIRVLSSAILDLALAVIKSADVTVSQNSTRRLAEQIQENAEANKRAYVERCALRQLNMLAAAS